METKPNKMLFYCRYISLCNFFVVWSVWSKLVYHQEGVLYSRVVNILIKSLQAVWFSESSILLLAWHKVRINAVRGGIALSQLLVSVWFSQGSHLYGCKSSLSWLLGVPICTW